MTGRLTDLHTRTGASWKTIGAALGLSANACYALAHTGQLTPEQETQIRNLEDHLRQN